MTLSVDVWSDIACPWCYVGKRRLEAALEGLGADIALRWRAFELDPNAPEESDPGTSYTDRLAEKYGRTPAQAGAMLSQMTETASAEGLNFDFDRIRSGNTFDAHRLLCLAHESGVQDAMKERLFKAYLEEGELMSDRQTLMRLAADVGIDAAVARETIESGRFAAEVREDEALAASLGVRGVPFFVFGGRVAVRGAAGPDELRRAIEHVLAELSEDATVAGGAICTPESC